MTHTQNAIEIRGISKSYNGVRVLHPFDLDIAAGQVHALVGQNGSGKSTLVKCLTGVHAPDSGTVSVYGETLHMPVHSPAHHGIAVIHQDIGLVGDMTVLENLGVNASYGTRLLSPISQSNEARVYRDLFRKLDIDLPLHEKVSSLNPAEHALIGVVRAMRVMAGHEKQIFILDEPTANLSRNEAERITKFMRRVAELGSSVIFISHRLNEVITYCDSVTIIRDGRLIETRSTSGLTKAELVDSMLGRRLNEFYPSPPPFDQDAAPILDIQQLTGNTVQDFNLQVNGGEIVGVTGLAGAGQEELPLLLGGMQQPRSGSAKLGGKKLPLGSAEEMIRAGVALVPANRKRDGLWMEGSAAENVTLPSLGGWKKRFGVFPWKEERAAARQILEQSNLRPLDPAREMRMFSGGNQQKVVFGKWLHLKPQLFLLDEPTQGVDAGAGKELLEQTAALAAEGTAVLVFSGDHEQLAAMCHRVVVLNDGMQVHELSGDQLTERALLESSEEHVAHPIL